MNREELVRNAILVGILLFIVSSEACAQYFLKKCKTTQRWHFFMIAVFFYSLVCLGLYNMYGYREMGVVNLMWSCLSIITIILVGVTFFHESINWYDIIGVIFVFIGFGFIFLYGHWVKK